MRGLICIDYTYDFIASDGALTTDCYGQSIEHKLAQLIEDAFIAGDYVVFAVDYHELNDPYHPETKLFPPHNIVGSKGRNLYGQVQTVYDTWKNSDQCYWLDKRRYSAFSGTDLDQRLRERGITHLILTGVCTDICVLHTAIDAYQLGYQITIPECCVASFNPNGHQWALTHFQSVLGATILFE